MISLFSDCNDPYQGHPSVEPKVGFGAFEKIPSYPPQCHQRSPLLLSQCLHPPPRMKDGATDAFDLFAFLLRLFAFALSRANDCLTNEKIRI